MSVTQLAEILNMKALTLRTYLYSYKFYNFLFYEIKNCRKHLFLKINSDFSSELAKILYMRKKWGSLKLWGDYCSINYLNILDEEEI